MRLAVSPVQLRRHVRLLLLPAIVVALVLTPGPAGAGQFLRAGTCTRDITPVSLPLLPVYEAAFGQPAVVNHADPVYIAGFGVREAEAYHDRIWACGVVLDRERSRVAIVALAGR